MTPEQLVILSAAVLVVAFLYSSVQLLKNIAGERRATTGRILLAMRWLALALFIIGLARPQYTESETAVKASGVDIVVAMDLSGSMESEDFQLRNRRVNRLEVARTNSGEMHAALFANVLGEDVGSFTDKRLAAIAEKAGVNMDEFNSCYSSKKFADRVHRI